MAASLGGWLREVCHSGLCFPQSLACFRPPVCWARTFISPSRSLSRPLCPVMQVTILNILALACVAVLLAGPSRVTAADALSATRHRHLNRQIPRDAVLKNEARSHHSKTRRCRQRPSNSTSASGGSAHVSHAPVKTSAQAAPAASATIKVGGGTPGPSKSQPSTPAPSHAPSGGSGGKKIGLAWPNGATGDLQHYATSSVGWCVMLMSVV